MNNSVIICVLSASMLSACITTSPKPDRSDYNISDSTNELQLPYYSYKDELAKSRDISFRKKLAEKIIRDEAIAKGSKFYTQALAATTYEINENQYFFITHAKTLAAAREDGVITEAQESELKKNALVRIETKIILGKEFAVTDELKEYYPDFGSPQARELIVAAEIEKILKNQNSTVSDLLPFYSYYKKSSNSEGHSKVSKKMKERISSQLSGSPENIDSFTKLKPILEYIAATGDKGFDVDMIKALGKVRMTRKDFDEQALNRVYPQFVSKELKSRVIALSLISEESQSIAGEIAEQIASLNEWVTNDEVPNVKIQLNRLRLTEKKANGQNITETVADPDFYTLLSIPKRASVMYDYIINEYSIQWSTTVVDPKTKKSRPISGSKQGRQVTCQNARFQNVFGGVGALDKYPNDRITSFCNSSKFNDLDGMRSSAIKSMAEEINSEFLMDRQMEIEPPPSPGKKIEPPSNPVKKR